MTQRVTEAPASDHLLVMNYNDFYCLGIVESAVRRNMRVTVAAPQEQIDAYPKTVAVASRVLAIDTEDEAAAEPALRAAYEEGPFTHLYVPFDAEIELAARLALAWGIPWNSPDSTARVRSKWRTRQTLAAAGLSHPEHYLLESASDLTTLLREQDGAWVIKPEHAWGSRGVSRVASLDAVEAAVARLRAVQAAGPFVAERCIEPATEYSVEGLWIDGSPHIFAITAKETSGPPYFVELGHTLPADLPLALDAEIRRTVTDGLAALGPRHGQFHVEVFAPTPDARTDETRRVIFGEGHVRGGGDRISQLLQLVGIDLDNLTLDAMYGAASPALPAPGRVAAVRYFSFPPGRVTAVTGVEEVEATAGVEHVSLHSSVTVGSALAAMTGTSTRHGRLVLVGDGFAQVCAEADRLARSICVTVEPVEDAPESVSTGVVGTGAVS